MKTSVLHYFFAFHALSKLIWCGIQLYKIVRNTISDVQMKAITIRILINCWSSNLEIWHNLWRWKLWTCLEIARYLIGKTIVCQVLIIHTWFGAFSLFFHTTEQSLYKILDISKEPSIGLPRASQIWNLIALINEQMS